MLYTSKANYIEMLGQDDGSWIVTLSRTDDSTEIRMHVFDLYGKDEEVLNEIEADKVDPIISGRIQEAHASAADNNQPQP